MAEAERTWNGYLSRQVASRLDQFEALVVSGAQELRDTGLAELASGAGEAAGTAVAQVSAAVGSGGGELPGPDPAELAEQTVATLVESQNQTQAVGSSSSVIEAGEPVVAQLQSGCEKWLSHLLPPSGQ